jgi:hypothetical protein
MNSKIVIAFIAGAVIASGIVYMAVREDAQPQAAAVPTEVPAPNVVPKTPPAALPVTQTLPTVPAPPARVVLKPTHREKPSPMPPPIHRDAVHRERPLIVARNQEPPPRPAPPPIEAQIPNEPAQPPPAPVPAAPKAQAPPVAAVAPAPAPAPAPPTVRVPPTVTIAAGTMLPVRIGETISVSQYKAGDSFLATLDLPLVVDGWVIAEKGSRLEGRVVEVASGRVRVELVRLSTSDGQHVPIRTDPFKKDAGQPAGIPVESRISFRVAGPVTITERIN